MRTWYKDICDPIKRFYDVISYRKAKRFCDQERYREAYVCFVPTKLTWMQYLLNKEFGHCYVVLRADNGYIKLDFYPNRVEVITMDEDEFKRFKKVSKRIGGHIIKVKIKSKYIMLRFIPVLLPNNCVTFTKNILGLRKLLVCTPYQLYKYLIANYEYMEV